MDWFTLSLAWFEFLARFELPGGQDATYTGRGEIFWPGRGEVVLAGAVLTGRDFGSRVWSGRVGAIFLDGDGRGERDSLAIAGWTGWGWGGRLRHKLKLHVLCKVCYPVRGFFLAFFPYKNENLKK